MSSKTLFLIDGSALAYRSYFAFIRNPLINSKGENTSVSFGFVNSLWSIINQHNPTHMAVVFDTKAPTHRHKIYEKYKSTRAKMPEDMADQLPRLHEVVEAMNIPIIEKEGVEADDVIGTLAIAASKENYDVMIVTSDKDFNQLVNKKIKILKPQKAGEDLEIIDEKGVAEKMGVPPHRVIDLLGLMGDSSDNVPGVTGVGPKTALKLLSEYDNLENVLKNADKISARGLREKVKANPDNALLSKELVTILTNVDLDYKPSDLVRKEFDLPRLQELFKQMEFKRFLQAISEEDEGDDSGKEKMPHKVDYKMVESIGQLNEIVSQVKRRREMTIDTETTSLNAIDSELVGISICLDEYSGWYISVGHDDAKSNLPLDETLKHLKPILEDEKIKKNGQNLKYDYQVFSNYDIHLAGINFDTMIAAYLINPSARQYNLARLAMEQLQYEMQPITDLIGVGKKQKSFATVPVDKATFYAVSYTHLTLPTN